MELVTKDGTVLATENELRKGFCYKGSCFLRARLPSSFEEEHKKKIFFFFDENYDLIESLPNKEFILQPDKEIFVFCCQIFLSGKKTVTGVDFSYRRISFEVDDETSTYYVVGSREFIKISSELEKKVKSEVKLFV